MKKIDNVYQLIISKENLYRSAYMASRGRRYRPSTADFNFFLEQEIERLHGELAAKSYRHGEYRIFAIHDPKERNIAAAPFRDRVVHHAVHDVIEPMIDKTFICDSYACRRNKGTHKAVDRAQAFLRQSVYCLHGDIRKYFPSINRGILKDIIRQRIGDESLLWLLDEIIDSAASLKSGLQRGLPIGNLTSQFFANLYLNELDYFVKFDLRQRHYVRYMDDFLVFSDDMSKLKDMKNRIRDFLKNNLDLDLHEGKSQIYKACGGIKFLGFRLFKNHRRLAAGNVRRFRKRLKRFAYLFGNSMISAKEISDSVRCWAAHSRYADTSSLRLKMAADLMNQDVYLGNILRDVISSVDNANVRPLTGLHGAGAAASAYGGQLARTQS